MSIWKKKASVDQLQAMQKNTIDEALGIEIIEVGNDFVKATMPVDHRTKQPFGILHGGASVVLAESLGSIAGSLASPEGTFVVGMEINANHIRKMDSGKVTGTVRPLHLGRASQVWEIKITNDEEKLVCISRLTVAVLEKRG